MATYENQSCPLLNLTFFDLFLCVQLSQWSADSFRCVSKDSEPHGTDLSADWPRDGTAAHGRNPLQVLPGFLLAAVSAKSGKQRQFTVLYNV